MVGNTYRHPSPSPKSKAPISVPSLPWVPTRARARPPRPSPRRELSCPWRRLTAWKLLSSSRLKTKITASAQPENLQGMRRQTQGHTGPTRSGYHSDGVQPDRECLHVRYQPNQLPIGTASIPHLGIWCPRFLSDQDQMSLPIHQHFFLVLLTCPEEMKSLIGQRCQVTKPSHTS